MKGKGLSIKDVRGQRVCALRTFYGTRGSLMRTTALFGAKTLIFWNLWCVRTDKGGLNHCGHFVDKEVGVNIAILCGRPVWTDPKLEIKLKLFQNLTPVFGTYTTPDPKRITGYRALCPLCWAQPGDLSMICLKLV